MRSIYDAMKDAGLRQRPRTPAKPKRMPSMVEATVQTAREAVRRRHDNNGPKKPRSLAIIANMLGAEGFDEHAMRCVEYYWLRRSGLTENQQMKFNELRKEFSSIMAGMTVSQRMVVGKFISWQTKVGFDGGLRIGLMAHASRAESERLGLEDE